MHFRSIASILTDKECLVQVKLSTSDLKSRLGFCMHQSRILSIETELNLRLLNTVQKL